MISKLLKLSIVKYFIFSCAAALIDLLAAYICYRFFKLGYLFSCNVGIGMGFVYQCFTSLKYVFRANKKGTFFIVYIVTFFIGLALADGTMWVCYNLLSIAFVFSKAASMGVPFFITYFIRRKLLGVKSQNAMEV